MPDIDIYKQFKLIDSGRNRKGFRLKLHMRDELVLTEKLQEELTKDYAKTIRNHLRDSIRHGRAPDGARMTLSAEAIERRRQLEARDRRGGEAHERYIDPKVRRRIRSNYDGAHKLRGTAAGLDRRGYHTGHLVDSMDVQKLDDMSYAILQPYNRSLTRILGGRRIYSQKVSDKLSNKISDLLEEALKKANSGK